MIKNDPRNWSFREAHQIRFHERDNKVTLHDHEWPTKSSCPPGWLIGKNNSG